MPSGFGQARCARVALQPVRSLVAGHRHPGEQVIGIIVLGWLALCRDE
jgi:hypothetical protein